MDWPSFSPRPIPEARPLFRKSDPPKVIGYFRVYESWVWNQEKQIFELDPKNSNFEENCHFPSLILTGGALDSSAPKARP